MKQNNVTQFVVNAVIWIKFIEIRWVKANFRPQTMVFWSK